MNLSNKQWVWLRLNKSGLFGNKFDSMEDCAYHLSGIQAQQLTSAAIATFIRTPVDNISVFKEKLFAERQFVRIWGQRRTLHIYILNDWPIIYAAFKDRPSWWLKKALAENNADDYLTMLKKAKKLLAENKILCRQDLINEGFDRQFLSSWGGVFADLEAEGIACHAQTINNRTYIAYREFWAPDLRWDPPSRDEALLTLVKRYFTQYGPASIRDLSYWLGLSIREFGHTITKIKSLIKIKCNNQQLYSLEDDIELANSLTQNKLEYMPIVMFPRYDPLLVAYKEKTWILDPTLHKLVWREAGIVESVIVIRGEIAGVWYYSRTSDKILFKISSFGPLDRQSTNEITNKCTKIAEFLETEIYDISFELIERRLT